MDRDGIRSTSSDGLTKNANGETISAMTFAVRVVVVRRGRPRVVVSRVANAVVAVVKVPLLVALLALAACGPDQGGGGGGGGGGGDDGSASADLSTVVDQSFIDSSPTDGGTAADMTRICSAACNAGTQVCGTQFQGPTNECVACGASGRDACTTYCESDWTLVETAGGWECRRSNVSMAALNGPHCNSGVLMVTTSGAARRFYCGDAVTNAGGSGQPCVQTVVQCDVSGCSAVAVNGCRGDVNSGNLVCQSGTCQ